MRYAKLMNVQANHFKFWEAKANQPDPGFFCTVTISFGRIRSWKQQKFVVFPTFEEACAYIAKKVAKKCAKGYEPADFLAVA
jgi:predicted DNA-binding WGR domain protein